VTEATFSNQRGCSAGHGYFVLGTVLPLCKQRLALWQGQETKSTEGDRTPKKRKIEGNTNMEGSLRDSELALLSDNGIVVLVRNVNSLQYSYALLTVSDMQPML